MYKKKFDNIEQDSLRIFCLQLAKSYKISCILDSGAYYNQQKTNRVISAHHTYDLIAGFGAETSLSLKTESSSFKKLKNFTNNSKSWLLGYLAYDLKNDTEKLTSTNNDRLDMPSLHFFKPRILFLFKNGKFELSTTDKKQFDKINIAFENFKLQKTDIKAKLHPTAIFKADMGRSDYLKKVERIRKHILDGDVYELNLCQAFYDTQAALDPYETYEKLGRKPGNPYSAFYRIHDKFVLCTSMERFLKKAGQKLISQPIKGTIKRGKTKAEDSKLAEKLHSDIKERAENVMIVDLVRNDLARSCETGSVKVEELFGVYPFPNVHQMISTVSGKIRKEVHPADAIKNAFPAGSMTGAPKLKAMELIEKYENTKRGIYAGSIGYFTPEMDFDFNVVIRTLIYDRTKKHLSLHAGSAITYDSVAEKEYEECLLKVAGIKKMLSLAKSN